MSAIRKAGKGHVPTEDFREGLPVLGEHLKGRGLLLLLTC